MGENQGGFAECRVLKTRRLRWSRGGGGEGGAFDLVTSDRDAVCGMAQVRRHT